MNLNQSVHFDLATLRSLGATLARGRVFLSWLAVLGLIGYTGYQLSRVTAVQASPGLVTISEAQYKVPSLHSSQSVVNQLKQLTSPGSSTVQVTTGKQNPFSLN